MSDAEVRTAVSDALRAFSVEMEQYIEAAGESAALHRTDLSALSHAMDAASAGTVLTPGLLASRLRLSPSATTAMLDRLETAGHIRRSRDSADRRIVTITITGKAEQTGYQIFVPLAQAFDKVMANHPVSDLAVVLQFLHQVSTAVHDTRPASTNAGRARAAGPPS